MSPCEPLQPSGEARRWYVARTRPHKEAEAAAILQQRGVEVYLPLLRHRRPRPGRRAWEPLFACYLFARLAVPSEQWLAARSAPHVAYFLGHHGEPVPVPGDLVEALRARVGALQAQGGPPRFRPGDRVTIVEGPFRYLDAIFDRSLSAAGRARVFVQVLQRLVPIELPEQALKRAG